MRHFFGKHYFSQSDIMYKYKIPMKFIRRFFGEPDRLELNTHNRNTPIKYYEGNRVGLIVRSKEFTEALEELTKNRESKQKATKKTMGERV